MTSANAIDPAAIPLAVGWSQQRLEALLAADTDPMQVVAAIAPGAGNAGYYSPEALQQLVREVQTSTLNGHLGHQDPATLSTGFPTVVVRWIRARWDGSKALVRGVVDKHAAEVKHWLRSGAITAPSIYTDPRIERRGGEKVVTGFNRLFGIDLAPLNRQGMQSASLVYVGESTAPSASAVHDQVGELMVALPPLEHEWRDIFTGRIVTDHPVALGEQQRAEPTEGWEWKPLPR